MASVKGHLFKLLFIAFEQHKEMRERLGKASDLADTLAAAEDVCSLEETLLLKVRLETHFPPHMSHPGLFPDINECTHSREGAIGRSA